MSASESEGIVSSARSGFRSRSMAESIRNRAYTNILLDPDPRGGWRPQFNAEMTGKSKIREPIIQNFVRSFPSDFTFFRLFEGAPLSDGHVEVIKCPEYPSDPSLKVSDFFETSTCFKNANVANPLVSALGSDFLSSVPRKFDRQNGRKRPW